MHHGQILDAHGDQAAHQSLDLVGVAGTHMEQMTEVRSPQAGGSRQGGQMGDTGLFHHWGDGGVVRRAQTSHQGDHIAVTQQLAHVLHAAGRHIGVIQHIKAHGATVHATLCVDLAEGRVDTRLHAHAQRA